MSTSRKALSDFSGQLDRGSVFRVRGLSQDFADFGLHRPAMPLSPDAEPSEHPLVHIPDYYVRHDAPPRG
jgi:hypothetical protein